MFNLYRPMMKASVVPAILFGSLVGQTFGQEAATGVPNRPMVHDQRPDDSRGWMVVAKATYWPLCYESLDRMEEAKALIGSANQEETAAAFEKCAAWLSLAASAAMTDGTAGVVEASELFLDASNAFQDGQPWSDSELHDLITLGLVVMAKSHVIRAEAPDMEFKIPRTTIPAKNAPAETKELVEAAKEIAKERIAQAIAQYRYDAIESQRHLVTAQNYLIHAAKAGNFELSEAVAASIPEFTATTPEDMSGYVDDELRTRIVVMRAFIAEKRKELKEKLAARIE